MVAGEEVAFSGSHVSDAERAAAGRETVAERTRALLPGNRERAATAWQGEGERVTLAGGVSAPMWPVGGAMGCGRRRCASAG